jgi:hypothetical protein
MDNLSRRSFLKKGTLAVGTAGIVMATPRLRGAIEQRSSVDTPGDPGQVHREQVLPAEAASEGPIFANLRNVATGEIDIFVGERRVTVIDRQTAARLYRATR